MNRMNKYLACVTSVTALVSLGPASSDGAPFAQADFRKLTIKMKESGQEWLLAPTRMFSSKHAQAESSYESRERIELEMLTRWAWDERCATARGPHTEAKAGRTGMGRGFKFENHLARAQGEVDAIASASSFSEVYFQVIGDPMPEDTVTFTFELDNASVIELDGGDASLSVGFSGSLVGRETRWLSIEGQNQEIRIDPISLNVGHFTDGEVIRLRVCANVHANVPEPGSLALLLLGGLANLARRIA